MSDTRLMSEFRGTFGDNRFRSTAEEYYDWKICKNPYGRGEVYLEHKDGHVSGSTTVTFKPVSLFGEQLLGAEITDAFTHPDNRKQGIFSRGVKHCTQYVLDKGCKIIYATPSSHNSQSLPIFQKKLGYPPCPHVNVRSLTKHRRILTDSAKAAAKILIRRESEGCPAFIAAMFKQRFFHSFASRGPSAAKETSLSVTCVHEFVDEVDGLWGKPRFVFAIVRDKTYLNWRYVDNPDDYQFLVAKEGSTCVGYLVIKVTANGKIATICDFITLDDRVDVFHALMTEAETRIEKAGAHSLRLMCVEGSPYFRVLLERGYYDHGAARGVTIIVYSGSDYGKRVLEEDAAWHFTMSDSDNI